MKAAQKKIRITAYLLFVSLMVSAPSLKAQRTKSSLRAGQQRYAEKGLKDNRYYFYFINSSISNFGAEKDKKTYKEAIQRDILSQLLYMKFLFTESFEQIRKSQEILIGLYRNTIIRDIRITMKLLNDYAPKVIKSNDDKARLYLRLGYRDSAVAKQFMVMADNYREKLYSLRLYKYVKAIKKAKHGKRYAFLSAIQCRLKEKERVTGLRWKSFDDLEKLLKRFYPRRMEYLQKIHYDNYYRTFGKKSLYDSVWEKPDFHELADYEEYMKKQ
jgi:hypothetical protein